MEARPERGTIGRYSSGDEMRLCSVGVGEEPLSLQGGERMEMEVVRGVG